MWSCGTVTRPQPQPSRRRTIQVQSTVTQRNYMFQFGRYNSTILGQTVVWLHRSISPKVSDHVKIFQSERSPAIHFLVVFSSLKSRCIQQFSYYFSSTLSTLSCHVLPIMKRSMLIQSTRRHTVSNVDSIVLKVTCPVVQDTQVPSKTALVSAPRQLDVWM